MSGRRTYVRPMKGWWLKNPVYVRYMIRESSSVFVTLYGLILLTGLYSLKAGDLSYQGWLQAMSHPLIIVFHFLTLAACLYHAVTWFKVAPKVLPNFYLGGKKVPDSAITIAQYLMAGVCYALLYWLIWRM